MDAKQHVHWGDVYCIYEAKADGSSGIEQAGLYARQIFSHQPNRTLVYALLHKCPKIVHLTRYDRAGCTFQGSGIDILTRAGCQAFSKVLVALLLLPPLYAGIDQTMSPNGLTFTLHDYVCDVQSTLAYRECIRGHATRAYIVKTRKRTGINNGKKWLEKVVFKTVEFANPDTERDAN